MKKIISLLFCFLAVYANADQIKMALLQPRVAEGSDACRPIELNMVRGELRKAFTWQSDFQVLTRTDVDAMMEEQGFQRTGYVDDNQRKKLGAMTGAQYVCVSTITKDGTQLYIESYLINIETGEMTNSATQYTNIKNNDYSILKDPCNALAKEMLGELGNKSRSKLSANTTTGKTNSSSPSFSYQAKGEFVNLGLPSGTLWKDENEEGYYTYEQAQASYEGQLPTKEQLEELLKYCVWTWVGNGYKVEGANKAYIFMPALGQRSLSGTIEDADYDGVYWSCNTKGPKMAYHLRFTHKIKYVADNYRFGGYSVRLVRKK